MTRCLLVLLLSAPFVFGSEVPGSGGRWSIRQDERLGDAKIAPYLGRDALWLRNNTHVDAAGPEFADGTIEFDLAPMKRGRFFAVMFRYQSFGAHENVYIRPMKSGQFDALQYTPRLNGGSTWQLYPEFNAAAAYPQNQWTRIRLEVRGASLEIFVGEEKEPALRVRRLRGDVEKGGVAFWARVNNEPEQWAAAISNVRITRREAAPVEAVAADAPPPGVLADWQLASEVHDAKGKVFALPPLSEWKSVAVEESGLVNVTRQIARTRGRKTAYLRTALRADVAELRLLHLGYSDEVTVFLNGKPLYAGVNAWESRYPRFLGLLHLVSETVVLPLKRGENELILALSDDQRFGWGLAASTSEVPPAAE